MKIKWVFSDVLGNLFLMICRKDLCVQEEYLPLIVIHPTIINVTDMAIMPDVKPKFFIIDSLRN